MRDLQRFLNDHSRPAEPPAGLADRIATAAVRDFHVRKVRRVVARSTALVAVLFVVGWMVWPKPTVKDVATRPILDPFTESNQLFAGAARKMDMPTIRIPDLVTFEMPNSGSAERLLTLPDRAKVTVEPVTNTMSRAANRWRKDFGSAFGIPQPRM